MSMDVGDTCPHGESGVPADRDRHPEMEGRTGRDTERGSESDRRQRHRLRGAGSARQKGGQRKGRWGLEFSPGAGALPLGNGINRRLLLFSLGFSVFSNHSIMKMDV